MNNLFFSRFCGLLLLCSIGVAAFAQKGYKRAYTLFNAEGKEIGYDELIEALAQPDVVFIGEIHNCCITHWLEYEITRSLYAIHKEKLMLGAEMLEADNQLILDEYMSRAISYDRFEAEARLWDNYSTDYAPFVFFAKENKIPFIATNVPRRYANVVKDNGLQYLDSLSNEAKRYLPPLPIQFTYKEEEGGAFALMQMMGKSKGNQEYLAQAHVGYYYERPSILSGVNSHRLAVMCQHSAGWQRTCRMEFKKALELGASGILIDEVQHHNNMPLCFDPTHGHPVPAHTFAGDLVLADQLLEMCREEGREDFLISGEACLDIQSTRYPFAYFRIGEEGGMHQNEMCMPVQRCIDSDYQNLCGVWGHNDRNSLNFCLMYRYVVSYETRHFRGDVDEFPQMLAYGEKMESLRKRYADYLWYTEFLGRHGAEVTGNVLYAVHRSKKTGKLAVVAINLADEAVPCQVSIAGAVALQLVTPETPEAVSFRETLEIPARSAAVIMEC